MWSQESRREITTTVVSPDDAKPNNKDVPDVQAVPTQFERVVILRFKYDTELLSAPASEQVARLMGARNILRGRVLKAAPDRIQLDWRGHVLEAVNSPSHSYLPEPGAELAFLIRPEYVRLIRKDRRPDAGHHMNTMAGRVAREEDCGVTWTLYVRLDEPGPAAQGDFDLEIEVPRMVYEILDIARERHWELSVHRGSIHVLPS
jgi:ABC-type Fe3+/spermidine/putrescine transport system ATPase subunit